MLVGLLQEVADDIWELTHTHPPHTHTYTHPPQEVVPVQRPTDPPTHRPPDPPTPTQVKIMGNILRFEQQATFELYQVEDGTGCIDCKFWIDKDESEQMGRRRQECR